MEAQDGVPGSALDPAEVIGRHLRDGDALTRSLAARALGAQGVAAAPALVAALLDQDPDVRGDALAALVACARREDAAAIRSSFCGDPVPEVKLAALQALVRLRDPEFLPLLRRLAKDRAEDTVTWEDEAGVWDDWLDLQFAAIEALGELGLSDVIDDLLEARADEMGQELDTVVFAALARLGEGGIAALFGLLHDADARVRRRALAALRKAQPEALAPMIDILAADTDPEVRILAVACLAADSPLLEQLLLRDDDPEVRRRSLMACAAARPDLARAALRDPDETLRALALEQIAAAERGPAFSGDSDLAANAVAWMRSAGDSLAATSAAVLPKLDPAGAAGPLWELAGDGARPAAARVAALRALCQAPAAGLAESLAALLTDPARALRIAALAALADLCDRAAAPAERDAAEAALLGAIKAALPADRIAAPDSSEVESEASLGASKVEAAGQRQIAITRDGDIVERPEPAAKAPEAATPEEETPEPPGGSPDEGPDEGNVIRGHFPRSTLEAIQAPPEALPPAGAGDLSDSDLSYLELAQRGRRRQRVSVEGPADIAADVRLAALRIGACCGSPAVESAIAELLPAAPQALRFAAFEALARRAGERALSPHVLPELQKGLADADPAVRACAARALQAGSATATAHLAPHLEDSDAMVRAEALKAVGRDRRSCRLAGLSDAAPLVRRTALQLVLDCGDGAELAEALAGCAQAGSVDVLTAACGSSQQAVAELLALLSKAQPDTRQSRAALEALAGTA